ELAIMVALRNARGLQELLKPAASGAGSAAAGAGPRLPGAFVLEDDEPRSAAVRARGRVDLAHRSPPSPRHNPRAPDAVLLVEVPLELLALLRSVQFFERLGLDLPDALARQPHHLPDLLQGFRLPLVQPE